ncbi:MAG: hypothetical protein AAB513_00020 [Patescibacteria group bacterium]
MTPTIFITLASLALFSGFLATFILRLAVLLEKRITDREENYDLLLAYCRIKNIEYVLLDDAKKNRLNLIVNFIYNTVWGLPTPFLLSFLIPATIIMASSEVAFLYLLLLIFVYFLIVHLGHLSLMAFYLNKENPFWKWGIKTNIIEALKRFIFSVAAVIFYLFLSYAFLFIIS